MRAGLEPAEWRAGLLGWGVRGALLALPSGYWAILVGFHHLRELLAMLLGTGLFVLVFAAGSAWQQLRATEQRRRWLAALRRAAWLKLAWMTAGIPLVFILAGLGFQANWLTLPLIGGAYVDFLTGTWLAEGLQHVGGPGITGPGNSFGWALLMTLLQGGAVTGELILAASVIFTAGSWRLRRPAVRAAKVITARARSPGCGPPA